MTLLQQDLLGKRIRLEKPELLAPAGSLEKLKFAVHYGADAVYIGGQQYGLRSNADNFTFEEMREGVKFAEKYGAKVFVATNIFAHNEDLPGLEEYLKGIQDAGVHAIIVADPVIIETCKRVAPRLEIHLSTQQSTMNRQAVQFWKEDGVDRVVLAREATMEEILEIKKHVDIEIEVFVHGAMCSSYSGRCVLSNHFTDRDSNRGGCCQSCRWKYDLFTSQEDVEQEIGMKEIPLFQEGDNPFSMSSKDLCMIEHVPELIRAGVDSFKIEGRMKSVHYVATVVNAYRQAIDAYFADPEHYEMKPEWLYEIQKAANRPLNTGFFYGEPDHEDHIFEPEDKAAPYDFVGVVTDYDANTQTALIQQRNHFKPGQEVEFFGPKGTFFKQIVPELRTEDGQPIDAARHPLQLIRMKVDRPVQPLDLMRKKIGK
ncbi:MULTISPECIES: peptidase U32 family protein [Paenibacillus]|uniref:Protease n=1 Tax=Paenibacillus naphthalenovorans TaxID=162209 RepID=A0A0U2MY05_9BACL|nr:MULTISPECIES: U32 family peptidase [Paenibacillus]ALS23151.1 protease [Paenibacillus naphthalenovorans]NTZ17244.1 U32 family peptidase [Paenibacillus sp. JMULE4]GCL71716.1 protease [Paenibacillus naphthalenovorans]SDI14125.1 putative protease [Paenibacillus naphthalenovorans]